MSNISRRKFLKGAGVAALAVAAAGVLAGCSDNNVPGTDVPDVPEVTSKTIDVIFLDNTTLDAVGESTTLKVLKDATAADPKTIDEVAIPAGYKLAKTDMVEIRKDGEKEYIFAYVEKIKTTKTIKVKTFEAPNTFGEATAEVAPDATGVYLSQIQLPSGYSFDPAYDINTLYSFEFTFVIAKTGL